MKSLALAPVSVKFDRPKAPAAGATVSTRKASLPATAAWARLASAPTRLRTVAPFSTSAFAGIEMPFSSFNPAGTVYVKVSTVVPLPPVQAACTLIPPMSSASVGVPPAVATFTTSSKVTVAVSTSPAFSVLPCLPVAPLSATLFTTGGVVSTVSA